MLYNPECSVIVVKAHPHKFQNCTSKLSCLNKSENNIMITNKSTSSDDWVQNMLVVQQLAYYWIIHFYTIVARIQAAGEESSETTVGGL